MIFEFDGPVIFWHGPSPFYFIAVPEQQGQDIKAISSLVTYGWGVIPVHVQVGETRFQTSLFPKNGTYLVPLKDSVRKAEDLAEGDQVSVRLEVRL